MTVPLVGKLLVRPAEGKVARLFTERLGTLALNQSTDGAASEKDPSSTANYRIVAAAAAELLHAGSLLMVVSTRTLAGAAAQALADTQHEADSAGELVASSKNVSARNIPSFLASVAALPTTTPACPSMCLAPSRRQ